MDLGKISKKFNGEIMGFAKEKTCENCGFKFSELDEISFYLKSGTNLSYKSYENITSLYEALDKNEVNMIIVPNIMYLDYTIEKDKYYLNYYFTEIKKQIAIT